MKFTILASAAVLAAALSSWAHAAGIFHRGDTVLLVGQNAAICPTVRLSNKLAEAYGSGNQGNIRVMMVDHGGPCLPSSMLRSTPLKVVVADRGDGITGVRLASNPKGGLEWVLPGFLVPAQ
ncbi:hypothetical protein GALL_331770 [mine drainage metagenome]|uniref:Uncharacterized protein n=1 Tax=mine drainage metagenome TaxID=410659 RepID=A0A1J5QNL0_9ZZZZ